MVGKPRNAETIKTTAGASFFRSGIVCPDLKLPASTWLHLGVAFSIIWMHCISRLLIQHCMSAAGTLISSFHSVNKSGQWNWSDNFIWELRKPKTNLKPNTAEQYSKQGQERQSGIMQMLSVKGEIKRVLMVKWLRSKSTACVSRDIRWNSGRPLNLCSLSVICNLIPSMSFKRPTV